MCGDSKPEDFEITKYVHDRAHELELNKFTHALELEEYKLLVLLNGGAAAALLTFAERATYPLTREGLFWPVAFWLVGLSAAAATAIILRKRQALYAKAYRHRRHAVEWRQFNKKDANAPNPVDPPAADLLARVRAKGDPDFADAETKKLGGVLHDKVATMIRDDAGRWGYWIFSLSLTSIGLFLAGAVKAALVATR